MFTPEQKVLGATLTPDPYSYIGEPFKHGNGLTGTYSGLYLCFSAHGDIGSSRLYLAWPKTIDLILSALLVCQCTSVGVVVL
jgi:hypothetical protein